MKGMRGGSMKGMGGGSLAPMQQEQQCTWSLNENCTKSSSTNSGLTWRTSKVGRGMGMGIGIGESGRGREWARGESGGGREWGTGRVGRAAGNGQRASQEGGREWARGESGGGREWTQDRSVGPAMAHGHERPRPTCRTLWEGLRSRSGSCWGVALGWIGPSCSGPGSRTISTVHSRRASPNKSATALRTHAPARVFNVNIMPSVSLSPASMSPCPSLRPPLQVPLACLCLHVPLSMSLSPVSLSSLSLHAPLPLSPSVPRLCFLTLRR